MNSRYCALEFDVLPLPCVCVEVDNFKFPEWVKVSSYFEFYNSIVFPSRFLCLSGVGFDLVYSEPIRIDNKKIGMIMATMLSKTNTEWLILIIDDRTLCEFIFEMVCILSLSLVHLVGGAYQWSHNLPF